MKSAVTDFVLVVSGSVGLTILAKATVVLLLGLVAGALSARAQASWRHLVFATTFAAVLALPIVVAAVPDLPIEVQSGAGQAGAASPISEPAAVPAAVVERSSSAANSVPAAASSYSIPSMATILLLAWIAGAAFLMLSLIVDLLRVRHIRRHGLPSKQLRSMVNQLTVEARLKPVGVLLHEKIEGPVTFGFFRPTVMLPADAENWSEADLRRAFMHELEHIRRGDWITQVAARVACAFYWFHPFIWMAWRRLCLEAERSCDNAVVRNAENTAYAEQLVSLSRQLATRRSPVMLGMAKRSDLARRVSSLLDTTQARGQAGLAAAALAVLIGSGVVIGIAPLKAVAQAAPKPEAEKETARIGDKIAARSNDDDDNDDIEGNPKDVALFKAAARNSIERAKTLIEDGANVNAELHGDGTPLLAAARAGHVEMVRLLLDRGAKPNLGIDGDGNPLLNAAREGHRDVVILLLDRGADINLGVEGDGNALIAASGAGQTGTVTLLLDRGADIHKVIRGDENAIIKASETGQLEVVKLLVTRGADVNSRVTVDSMNGKTVQYEIRTPLSMARRYRHTAVVDYLLSVGARQ
jgi:beta-lactamase regulating signal transducer with metallopeptidase domain/ankyrin repeat protein